MYWNDLYLMERNFSPNDMFEAIKKNLKLKNSPYFQTDKELTNVVDILTTYMMHVPKLILPENTEYNPKKVNIPARVMLLHFHNCHAHIFQR